VKYVSIDVKDDCLKSKSDTPCSMCGKLFTKRGLARHQSIKHKNSYIQNKLSKPKLKRFKNLVPRRRGKLKRRLFIGAKGKLIRAQAEYIPTVANMTCNEVKCHSLNTQSKASITVKGSPGKKSPCPICGRLMKNMRGVKIHIGKAHKCNVCKKSIGINGIHICTMKS